MKITTIFEGKHRWVSMGRDPLKPGGIIDTNQYLIVDSSQSMLIDPGGIEIFASMLAAVVKVTPLENITHIFASHQDPDIISSLGLWDQTTPHARLHAPWLWESFIRHFGMNNMEYCALPDEGRTITLDTTEVVCVPAHYLHSSGNFHLYDPEARIFFSGDVGAALDAPDAPMFVSNFAEHIPKMEYFHKRWMPSNTAKRNWVARVRQLDVDILAPQHGGIFRGDDVKRFLDWFEALEVGIAA